MKKQLFFSGLCLSALSSLMWTACEDYIPFSEEEIKATIDAREYDQHFIDRFGEPAEGHDWGMKLLAPTSFDGDAATRATSDNVNVNRNQWCERTSSAYKTDNYVLANTIKVPGWPNFDGYYYASRGEGSLTNILTETDMFANQSYQPVGDVTQYEIQYVSTWFRTHQYPKSVELHLSDFFIQNVSCDNDQLTYEGAVDCRSLSENPQNLNGRTPGPNGLNAEYANDVVYPNNYETENLRNTKRPGVIADVKKRSGQENSNEHLNYSMDYLHFMSIGGDKDNLGGTGWTHINNFNRGNSNFNPEESTDTRFREIKYVHSSGTEDFACRSSMATESEWINKWVLVRLEWEETGADGVLHTREGYYLAFDFANTTGSTEIGFDGFYSNWIVKISPAYFTPNEENPPKTARIMCEDLGGSFDFDFNDVVFDVSYDQSKTEAVICIQASGGTLPIVVGDVDKTIYETHKLLGQGTNMTPVNVAAPGNAKHEVAIYRVNASNYLTVGKLDPYKIPIYVKQNDNWINTNDNIPTMTEDTYGKPNSATASKVPRKFATKIGVEWMKELEWIDKGYSKFINWVKEPGFYWELNNKTLYWYDEKTDHDKIYEIATVAGTQTGTSTSIKDQWWDLETIEVKEDFTNKELALDYITIAHYGEDGGTNVNSIVDELNGGKTQLTFAYIFKTKLSSVKATLVPIWIIEGKPYFKNPENMETLIDASILSNANSYTASSWQQHFAWNKSKEGDTATGIDPDGNYTFVSKFGFYKSDLYVDDKYCDYMALYVYEDFDITAATESTPASVSMKSTKPVTIFETYVIF